MGCLRLLGMKSGLRYPLLALPVGGSLHTSDWVLERRKVLSSDFDARLLPGRPWNSGEVNLRSSRLWPGPRLPTNASSSSSALTTGLWEPVPHGVMGCLSLSDQSQLSALSKVSCDLDKMRVWITMRGEPKSQSPYSPLRGPLCPFPWCPLQGCWCAEDGTVLAGMASAEGSLVALHTNRCWSPWS